MLELLFSLFNIHRNPHACWLTSQCFPQTCNSPWSTVKVLRVFKLQPPNFLSQSRNTSLNHLKLFQIPNFLPILSILYQFYPPFWGFPLGIPQARWMVDFMISWKIRQWMIWRVPPYARALLPGCPAESSPLVPMPRGSRSTGMSVFRASFWAKMAKLVSWN